MDTPPQESAPEQFLPFSSPAVFSPITEGERHHLIDALRGMAIFGIFLVNMWGFKAPVMALAGTGDRWLEGTANSATLLVIEILASGKFVTMFALLFGMGMVMQEQRARVAGRKFGGFFFRRMVVLLMLGVVHGIFLWAGDILAVYALFGIVGLLFVGCRAKTLIIWAGLFFLWVMVVLMSLGALAAFDDGSGDAWWIEMGEWWVESYQTGTFAEIVVARLVEWGMIWGFGLLSLTPYAFAVFLLGMALAKIDILANLDRWQPRLRLFVGIALPVGFTVTLMYIVIYHGLTAGGVGMFVLGMGGYLTGMLLLGLAYMVLFSFFFRSGNGAGFVRLLASVGRLALTNYLLQSIIANVIFMSWGFGLYGKVEAQWGVLIVITVFIGQLFLSHLWLRYFEIGPFEWIWRAVSYGTAPRLLRRGNFN